MRQEAGCLVIEWYIDIFFLVNFSMDVLLLLLLGKILKLPIKWLRLIAGGMAGAGAACLAVWFWYLPLVEFVAAQGRFWICSLLEFSLQQITCS